MASIADRTWKKDKQKQQNPINLNTWRLTKTKQTKTRNNQETIKIQAFSQNWPSNGFRDCGSVIKPLRIRDQSEKAKISSSSSNKINTETHCFILWYLTECSNGSNPLWSWHISILNLPGLRQELIDGVRGYLSLILERVIEENRLVTVMVEWVIGMEVGRGRRNIVVDCWHVKTLAPAQIVWFWWKNWWSRRFHASHYFSTLYLYPLPP